MDKLKSRDFKKVWTKYDKHQSNEYFRRYEKVIAVDRKKALRMTIDFFVSATVPFRNIKGWNIVEPKYLLSLYSKIHSSDKCFAVQAALGLLENNIDPVDRKELVERPQFR